MLQRALASQPRHRVGLLWRGREGFSLIEVVLVAALAAGLFLLSIQYVVGLIDSSESAVEGSGVRRDAALVTEAITSELRRARVCDPYGLDAPFREVREDKIEFYVDVNGDGILDVVAYRVEPQTSGQLALQRGERLATTLATGEAARCGDIESPADFTTVAPSIQPVSEGKPVFEPLRDGRVYVVPLARQDTEFCGAATRDTNPEYCLFDGIHIQLSVISAGRQEIPVPIDETVPVSLQGSRL